MATQAAGGGADDSTDTGTSSHTPSSAPQRAVASLRAASYEEIGYWDERYAKQNGKTFDWYLIGFDAVEPVLRRHLTPASTRDADAAPAADTTAVPGPAPYTILELGCGNSPLSVDIAAKASWLQPPEVALSVVACDYSEVLIKSLRDAARAPDSDAEPPNVRYVACDARSLPFDDASFDAVVEKATLDCVDVSADPGDTERVVLDASRVLRPGGAFVTITCRDPERRLASFAKCIGGGRRGAGASDSAPSGDSGDADVGGGGDATACADRAAVTLTVEETWEVPKRAGDTTPDRQHAIVLRRQPQTDAA